MPLRRKKVQRFEDTAANWTAEDPILPQSWEGVESDTGQWKQGDGVTAWSALPYRGTGGGGGTETTTTLGTLINGATAKATPVDADNVPITDSAASHITKKVTWANVKATLKTYFDTLYPAETASTLGATINAAAAATPNNADLVATVDSSVAKKITWTNVKAFLKTYFDTQYTPIGGTGFGLAGGTPNSVPYTNSFGLLNDEAAFAYDDATNRLTVGSVSVGDDPYDATNWNGSLLVPTKNAVRDEIEAVKLTIGGGGYSDEAAQDAVGGILTDSSEIDFTYSDAAPSITASIVTGSIDETKLDASVNASLAGELTGNTQTGTTYSLVAGDKGKEVRMTNAAAKTVTIDPTGTLGTGFVCMIANFGAGAMTLAPGSGVTLRKNIWKIGQYKRAKVSVIGTDEYLIDADEPDPIVALTDGANIATDCALGTRFRVTLGGNRTLDNPTNPQDGFQYVWEFIQDGTGSRTITLDTKFAFGSDITSLTLTTAAGKVDYVTAIYNSAADKFRIVGVSKGY